MAAIPHYSLSRCLSSTVGFSKVVGHAGIAEVAGATLAVAVVVSVAGCSSAAVLLNLSSRFAARDIGRISFSPCQIRTFVAFLSGAEYYRDVNGLVWRCAVHVPMCANSLWTGGDCIFSTVRPECYHVCFSARTIW